MKILRAIGFLLAIFGLKFVLMWSVFRAFEGSLISLFRTFSSLMSAVPANLPASF
ncbi:MAG: hypothetical protein UW74_C0019G0013 [Candidatus Giovannonibacteria bacterium GW2011_GWC2_44_8]|uniref:Uncharacterized protein n=2 Tax=Candidatus Giovannoniibacteriota TaxID=1752738 RepID=A0A0G1LQK5_9BACT|nr:MAG: hypothetical protein UW55_C0016G0004 [Candidatus Giovannonibacteria bacterium GW2011_GWA2_44_26]KKT78694.1 MAG: hypothetical protein UW74_C0019G0013 [Candidatus Giovannonibacteria bacterium GW2011_GWC2_44_8]